MPNVLNLAGAPITESIDSGQSDGPPEAPTELVNLYGISSTELSPRVQLALTQLSLETQDLRRALITARTRIGQLEHLANCDPLTPTLNRRAFLREIERHQALLGRRGEQSSVLFVDVDRMKLINDRFGHAFGDGALRWVAEVLSQSLRHSDVLGRLGGDEFGVLLVDSDVEQARHLSRRLELVFASRRLRHDGRSLTLSCSFGQAALEPGSDPEQVLAAADRAMYRDKQRSLTELTCQPR